MKDGSERKKEREIFSICRQQLVLALWCLECVPAEKQTSIEIMLGFSGESCHCRNSSATRLVANISLTAENSGFMTKVLGVLHFY